MPPDGRENNQSDSSLRRVVDEPDCPDEIPTYVSEGVERQDVAILHDIVVYSEELLQYVQQPPSENTDDLTDKQEELLESVQGENWTQVQKMVDCGKQCSGCPHGPYLYLVRRESPTKLRWEYVGPAAAVASEFPDLLDEEPSTNVDDGRVIDKELDDAQKEQLERIQQNADDSNSDDESETDEKPPEPPSAIPAYISDGIGRQDEDTLDAIIRYAQDLMEWKEYQDYKSRLDDPNSAVEKPQVPSFDDVAEDSWSDSVDPKYLKTGDIVKIINKNELSYQSAEVQEFKQDKVIIITETGDKMRFDMDGYSENLDVLEAEYVGKTGQNE